MQENQAGVVIATRGRLFEVRGSDGQHYRCEVRQKVKTDSDRTTPVAVGDDVLFEPTHEGCGIIFKVRRRKTAYFRPAKGKGDIKQVIAANLDRLAVVVSVKSPALKTGLIDRCLIAARVGDLDPMIIINKTDLRWGKAAERAVEAYRLAGFAVFPVSAVTSDGLADLRRGLTGHRTLFTGHSGVGKSTLLNNMIPGLDLKTLKVSSHSNRGRHATTSIELFELPFGGYVVDSPGLKVMGLWEVSREDLPYYYPEFESLSDDCRFQPCSHTHEPGCAVKAAVEEGRIASFRWDNYVAIAASLAE